jgi:hypothetical protein
MNIDVPVSPFVGTIQDQDDVVFSLVNLAPAKDIRLQIPAGPVTLSEAHLTYATTSVEALAEVGITSAVTVSNKFHGSLICFNVELLASGVVRNEIQGGLIESATLGVGFRIGVVAFNFQDEAKVATPALLAASTTLNMSSSLFEVAVVGAGLGALPAVKPLILSSISAFDMSTFQTLGAVEVALNEYLVSNKEALSPVLLSVSMETSGIVKNAYPTGTADFKADALAQTYAFERAYHGASQEQAIADPRVKQRNLNIDVIKQVYGTYLQLKPGEQPTPQAHDDAGRVLSAGRY